MGAVLVGVALAGCARAEAPPDPLPSEAVTAPSTGSATPAPPTPTPTTPEPVAAPERPAAMDQPDETGAVAAAEYVLQLYAYALSTGDLTAWDALSGQSCEFCENTRADVDRVYADGGFYQGGELRDLYDVQVVGRDEQLGVYGVQVGFHISGGREYDGAGTVIDEFPPERSYLLVELVPSTRGWILVGGTALDGPLS